MGQRSAWLGRGGDSGAKHGQEGGLRHVEPVRNGPGAKLISIVGAPSISPHRYAVRPRHGEGGLSCTSL